MGAMTAAAAQLRVARAARPLTDRWRRVPVEPRGQAKLGISFRPLQAQALGLEPMATLSALLSYEFELIRLGAYWDHIETGPGRFDTGELDRQVDAAERAGKQIILCLGPVKTFGYPEFFVPGHRLPEPLPEGILVEPAAHPALAEAGAAFIGRLVERYRDRKAIVAWQVEHDAVDPLGLEHSWRLSAAFVRREVEAVRAADPTRPVLLNGFLPTSVPVRLQQWWRTRDQGDSLVVAQQLADIVGIDFYPRHAVVAAAGWTVYLAGRIGALDRRRALVRAAAAGRPRLMIIEGQAEPWEAVTTPPSPQDRAMYSCLPEHVVENYSQCMRWHGPALEAYLFWGAEYWVLRQQQGDPRYLQAFARVLAGG
jgi:Beta-galactosidase